VATRANGSLVFALNPLEAGCSIAHDFGRDPDIYTEFEVSSQNIQDLTNIEPIAHVVLFRNFVYSTAG
jgi:hypothetical protein